MIELIEAKCCGNCIHNTRNVSIKDGGVGYMSLSISQQISYCELHNVIVSGSMICITDDWEKNERYRITEDNVRAMRSDK